MMIYLLGAFALCLLVPAGIFAAVCICACLPRRAGKGDVLLVLGARVHPDGVMSRNLQLRCETALDAWKQGRAPKLMLCGGICPGDPGPEADYMRAFMMECGVPEDAILVENRSSNTVENLKNAKQIMAQAGMRRALLVTSDYHLTRALWITRALGISAEGVAAPSPKGLRIRLKARFRETASWMLYFAYRFNRNERLS